MIEAGFSVAVDIQDRRSLEVIPKSARFVIMDIVFMALIGIEDKSLLNKRNLIVKNIDSYDIFEELKVEGVTLFSGSFIEKPQKISEEEMSSNKFMVLKLITTLNDPDIELEQVSKIISLDSVMSYKSLKLINSPL